MAKKVKKAKKKAKKKVKKKRGSSANAGRDNNGYFAKGNKIGVGNTGRSSEHARELKRALIEAVTEKDIKAILKKMITQAKAGDNYARKELFDRLWGRAIQEVDIGDNTVKTITDILAICGIGNASSDGE